MNDDLIVYIAENILNYVEYGETNNFDNYLKTLSNNLIEKFNLEKYAGTVNILEVNDNNPSSRGSVDKEGNMCIFKSGIEKSLEENLEEMPGLSKQEISLYRCLLYTKTILHELEHKNQEKLLLENCENEDVETLIVRLCESSRDSVSYFCLYDSFPTERLAELKALRTVSKVVDKLESKFDIPLLSCYIKKEASLEEFYDYYKYGLSGPTEGYFDFWNSENLSALKEITQNKEISLEKRVLYGLEISREEYEGLVMQYATYEERANELSAKMKK